MSKDINLRIKAVILGVYAADYYNVRLSDDANLLYGDTRGMAANF